MCGIFGLIASPKSTVSLAALEKLGRRLFQLSETRGKDASGILAITDTEILVYKDAERAAQLLKRPAFAEVINHASTQFRRGGAFAIAGHTRMVTNGSEAKGDNNQPVIIDEVVVLHNGIIVNDTALWKQHPEMRRSYEVDTEVFGALLSSRMAAGESYETAMRSAFADTCGANTIMALHARQSHLLLGTTNGSLYFCSFPDSCVTLFGSAAYILRETVRLLEGRSKAEVAIQQVPPETLLALSLSDGKSELLSADAPPRDFNSVKTARRIVQFPTVVTANKQRVLAASNRLSEIERLMRTDTAAISALTRCNCCLLPETFPFITFDHAGVCNFCQRHKPLRLRGPSALKQLADSVGRSDRQPDCLVPISGGRDSCYGLHYVKKELGLNPVAYTYDWGFVTDLARRNISRMCGALNVEHILVAADIRKKRDNVRKNVSAWLTRPALSMIPLFMAGDKAFFHYASMIRRQMNLGPILFSMNWLEKTGFKTGFAGVNDSAEHDKTYGLTRINQLKLIAHYGYNFLSNPHYLNSSIPDTLFGFLSYYLQAKDYYSIFDFLCWDQTEIERVIINEYDWELSPDTSSTWRIGDGTAPFYNYIYLTVAGFTEHDTFRSNQIREGLITREKALLLVEEENQPRPESFKWYCDTVGIDAIETLKVINKIQKLYPD
jgi:glucosamine--fructose-6-phosphate aminotransferase (isomerizing)